MSKEEKQDKITYEWVETVRAPFTLKTETDQSYTFETTLKGLVIIHLGRVWNHTKEDQQIDEDTRNERLRTIRRIINFLNNHVNDLELKSYKEGKAKISIGSFLPPKEGRLTEQDRERINKEAIWAIGHPLTTHAVLFASQHKDYLEDITRKQEELRKQEEALSKKAEALKKQEQALERREGKKGKFKRAGQLHDQILKYDYPKDNQLKIWEQLGSDTIKEIEVAGVEVSEVVEGIKLSPSETKLIDCLCKLLHKSSQNSDPKKEDYYTGNIGYELVEHGLENTPAPRLSFTLYELTKEYIGGDKEISGKHIENFKEILTGLNNKKFLIKYTEVTRGKKGEWIRKGYEAFRKLIEVDTATLSYGVGHEEHYRKRETVILLNPIFRRQIDSKFILYPDDITTRTAIAYGSQNVSETALRLRDYLMRELSSKRYKPEINQERLYYLLAEKWMKQSRKKMVREYTKKAIETVTALDLLSSYEIKTGSTGEPKFIFHLNKDWE